MVLSSPHSDTEVIPDSESLSAEELILAAYERFGDRLCLTCSWQKQSSVLVHMVSELDLPIEIVELDTQLFFRESYETRDRLLERYPGMTIVRPEVITVAEQHRREGPNLWEREPDRCCEIRKVEPLVRALEPYDAWASGIRRDQSPSRAWAVAIAEDSEQPVPWLFRVATRCPGNTTTSPDRRPAVFTRASGHS